MSQNNNQRPLRLAVIGGGHLGRIHAKLAANNENFQLLGVVDPSNESQRVVQEELKLPTFSDFQQIVGQVDCAIVAAPTVHHYEIASQLLRSGIHCFIEKPLATTPDQAQRLVQIAKSHSRVLQVGHVERFNPMWTTAQNSIGAPKYIDAVRAGAYSGRSTDIGVVMDLMIHDLDLILSIDRSEVMDVQASGLAVLGSHEDIAEARLQFESGCIVNISASRLSQSATRRMQVYSATGYADLDFSADELHVVRPTDDVLTRVIALDELPASDRMEAKEQIFKEMLLPENIAISKRNAILDEHNDFVLSIGSGASPSVTGEDGARAVEVANRILESVKQHAWDGSGSKPWRVGPNATETPRILPLPTQTSSPKTSPAKLNPRRRAG
ncbi:MAG: Gfo/Idh/MocA family protein [Pirellulaceae bacterium]